MSTTTLPKLTADEAVLIGREARDYSNPMIGAFAAEMAGESYPFSAAMTEIMLKGLTDEDLGRRFSKWCEASLFDKG